MYLYRDPPQKPQIQTAPCLQTLLQQQSSVMKVGFGSKGKKHKHKKGKKKNKQGKSDGDERMADVQQPGTPVKAADMEVHMQQPTAKDKQRKRMELKRALKVNVAGLKSKRCAGQQEHLQSPCLVASELSSTITNLVVPSSTTQISCAVLSWMWQQHSINHSCAFCCLLHPLAQEQADQTG